MSKAVEYDLWFDESGQFEESLRGPTRQTFPSQLAGLLVPHGKLTAVTAEAVLADAHRAAKLPLADEVHAFKIAGAELQAVVGALLPAFRAHGWQPVRLVNQEGVSYGSRVATYTQIVAELALRVFHQLARKGHAAIDLHVIGALVKTGERDDRNPELIDDVEYIERLQEALTFLAVRRGLAGDVAGWRVVRLSLLSGIRRRELQLCDVVSNASHASFKKCGPELEAAFREALGPFDQTLVLDQVLEGVDDLLRARAHARALTILAEACVDAEHPERAARPEVRRRLGSAVGRLAAMGARARDPELRALTTWLEQVVEQQRSPTLGAALASFFLREVEAPIRRRLEGDGGAASLDWFTYALHRWTLTAANHVGDLLVARAAATQLERLTPSLAGSWEHAPLLVDGMLANAVHRTDCFAHDEASRLMEAVAGYYGELSGLFSAAMPGVFPERVRSRTRGEALGTRMQSEMLAGLRDEKRFAVARRLSDEALDELVADDDKARQRQYRCQLETLAGDLPRARELLGASLGLEEATHAALGEAIASGLGSAPAQGFALLHWLRLGRAAALSPGAEREAFLAAWKASKIAGLPWLTGKHEDYPVHGILRYAAGIHALAGAPKDALGCVTLLRRARSTMVLSTILVAALVEVAGLLWGTQRKEAERLLDNKERERPGALQVLYGLGESAREAVPELWGVFAPWEGSIRGVMKGAAVREPREVLLGLGRVVGY